MGMPINEGDERTVYLCNGYRLCGNSPNCGVNHGGLCYGTTNPAFAMHKEVLMLNPAEHPECFEHDECGYYERRITETQ